MQNETKMQKEWNVLTVIPKTDGKIEIKCKLKLEMYKCAYAKLCVRIKMESN